MFGKKKQALLADRPDQPRMSANVTEFMEKLGLSGDEIAEMANPISDQQRRIEESETTLATFVMQTNAMWSERMGAIIDLQPKHMLPTTCWDSLDTPDRTLLMDVLGLLPAQPWNIVLLAANDETAALLGVGRHPRSLSEEERTANNLASLTIAEELEIAKRKQGATLDPSRSDLAEVADQAPDAATARIIALARPVASASLGQDVVDHSRSTFFGD